MSTDPFDTLRTFVTETGASGKYHSLAELDKLAPGRVSRLPVSTHRARERASEL